MANLLIKRYPTPPKPPADLDPGDVYRIQHAVPIAASYVMPAGSETHGGAAWGNIKE